MAEQAPAAVTVPVKPRKKPATRTPREGPSLPSRIVAIVSESKDRKGVSLPAIKKALAGQGVDVDKNKKRINKALQSQVEKGVLDHVKGVGASGSFKVRALKREKKVKQEKKREKNKKVVAKKKPSASAKAKKPAVKAKKVTPKAKKSPAKKAPKKPAAKKSPEKKAAKKASPKKAAAKKVSPKKVAKRNLPGKRAPAKTPTRKARK